MNRMFAFAGLAGAVALVSGLSGCRKSAETTPAAHAAVVRVAPVEYSTEAVPIRVPGLLSRRAEVELSFKIGGFIQEVTVRAGDAVKKGDLLARLRPDEIEAQVVQARSALEKAQRDFDRVQRLRDGNVATIENAQDAETAVRVAAAGLKIAEFNRDHATIVAPSDGYILRRTGEPDELVGPGKAILTFGSNADGWLVRVGLSERDVLRIQPGDAAEIGDESFAAGATVPGTVTHIAEAAEAATRTTEVEISLAKPLPSARSGYVVSVLLHPVAVAARPVVPASALIEGTDRHASVFLVDAAGKKAKRLSVVIDEIDRDRIFVKGELPRDGRIVTLGAEYLVDGSAVEVIQN